MPCFWKTRAATAWAVTIWATVAVRSYESMWCCLLDQNQLQGACPAPRRARSPAGTDLRGHGSHPNPGATEIAVGRATRRRWGASASSAQEALADPVARELVGDAAASVPLLVGPGERRLLRLPGPIERRAHLLAQLRNPLPDHRQVLILREGVEGHPQAEAPGERDLLLYRLAVVDLVPDEHRSQVVRLELGEHVAPVGGDVDERVLRRRVHRPVQRALQHLVARLADLERDVVREEDEAVRLLADRVDDRRQAHQVVLVHLDDAQAIGRVGPEERADQGRLAGAARPPQQDVVGGIAGQELERVALHHPLLLVDPEQIGELDPLDARDRLQVPGEGAPPPVGGVAARPVDLRDRPREQHLERGEDAPELVLDVGIDRHELTIAPAPKPGRAGGGAANTGTAALSVARMRSPAGWVEPGQSPEFDEYTLVLRGVLQVESRDGVLEVAAGQAVLAPRGEWVRYSTPGGDGAEYIAICLPAFSPGTVHRDVG